MKQKKDKSGKQIWLYYGAVTELHWLTLKQPGIFFFEV